MNDKLVEIDEAELLRLRRMEGTLGAIVKNKGARKQLAAALKVVNPEDPLAKEADVVDPDEQRFIDQQKEIEALKKSMADDKSEREHNSKLDSIKAEQERAFAMLRDDQWTQEGIDKVRKVMEDKGILDVAIAAKWVESQMPPQNPISPTSNSLAHFLNPPKEDEDVKKLWETRGENDSLLMKMAGEALSDIRGPRR